MKYKAERGGDGGTWNHIFSSFRCYTAMAISEEKKKENESESDHLFCHEEDGQALYWCRESLYQTIQ